MLFFLILLAQGAPPLAPAPTTAPKHAWTGRCPGADTALFESIEKASLEALEAQLFDAKAAIATDPGDLAAVVKASTIAMDLRRRQQGKEAVIAVRACHKSAMLDVPDPAAPGYAWWLMSDEFFFDYVKHGSGNADVDKRLVACAAITPFQNALKLRDIKGVPRRLRTAIALLPKDDATALTVQVLRDTASTGAAFDLLPGMTMIARSAGLTHPQFDWYESVGWTCLDAPRKALPLLEGLARAMPANKAVLENLKVERGRVEALDNKTSPAKTTSAKAIPAKATPAKATPAKATPAKPAPRRSKSKASKSKASKSKASKSKAIKTPVRQGHK